MILSYILIFRDLESKHGKINILISTFFVIVLACSVFFSSSKFDVVTSKSKGLFPHIPSGSLLVYERSIEPKLADFGYFEDSGGAPSIGLKVAEIDSSRKVDICESCLEYLGQKKASCLEKALFKMINKLSNSNVYITNINSPDICKYKRVPIYIKGSSRKSGNHKIISFVNTSKVLGFPEKMPNFAQ